MKVNLFDYQLPRELIANKLADPRDKSKLMIVDRLSENLEEDRFFNLRKYLRKGDVLVFNQSKVIPARVEGRKETGGKVEILLIRKIGGQIWEVISKPSLRLNQKLFFGENLEARVIKIAEEGKLCLKFSFEGQLLHNKLFSLGRMPLPPYIIGRNDEERLRHEYQTVFAKNEGSVAAPTAGLHFSLRLMKELKKEEIGLAFVDLHVSLGTFRGVKTERVEDHVMHSEWFCLSQETANKLNDIKKIGGRVIVVGTTVARVLESCSNEKGEVRAMSGETEIFIYPPYKFRFIDGLITNFHLPKSTLLMLVSAFVSWPNTDRKFTNFQSSLIGRVYKRAIEKKYRFYSFGDGMLIL